MGGRLQLQVALAGGVPAAEREVAGQVLGPHGLSTERCHLGLKKTGYSVKAWRLGVGRGVLGMLRPALLCSKTLSCSHFPLEKLPSPVLRERGPVWQARSLPSPSKKGHRVLGAGSVRGGWPTWPLRGSSITGILRTPMSWACRQPQGLLRGHSLLRK